MTKFLHLTALVAGGSVLYGCGGSQNQTANLNYPRTDKVDTVISYFDTEVADPYQWLEDDQSVQTGDWVKAQNEVTNGYLSNISYRDKVVQRLEELQNYARYSAPDPHGDYYYFAKNDGLQNQSVWYRVKELDGDPEVFLDPNSFSEDGTTALGNYSFSKDNEYFAYSTSTGGSDWRDIYVMKTNTKEKLDDQIKWAKFTGMAWHKDGFFYQRFAEPKMGAALSGANQYGKIYYHRVGTDQSADKLIHENPKNPENRFGVDISDDEKFLILYSSASTSGNELFFKDLTDPSSQFQPIVKGMENEHAVVAMDGDNFLIETNLNAPNRRLVKAPVANPSPDNWVDVIPESENVLSASAAGGYIFANYLVDAKTAVKQFTYDGTLVREVGLPGIGTAGGFSGDPEDTELFYTFTSFTEPSTIFKYAIEEGTSTLHRRSEVKFNPDEYVTKQVFYNSDDGTRIPMFIVHKKGLELNGKNPTMLYSYGGFNISLRPSFSTTRIVWLENGGIFAMPNIRGGGEYGEEWHQAGTKTNKKNVFKDFIAAGDYLIKEGYTSSDYLAIRGGSNGGLLIGATINMRPDLAKVAFPQVGVMDMLRYQYFTIGRAWSADYGTSEDSREMFEYLYSYSPLHNIDADAEYPAVLVTTADHDDRVVPAHSFKYMATLQEKRPDNKNPLLIRIETNAGHGAGMSTSKRLALTGDIYSYAWYNMGVTPDLAKEEM